jgi:predicted nuclease of predicted toxin-antitoxin system
MKLLLNENISGTVINALRQRGHNVISVKESMKGVSDRIILERAQNENCIIITNDKDFGELAFHFRLPAESGVILFRLSGVSPEDDNARVIETLESGLDFKGNFCVVTDERIRIRPLPIKQK